MITDWIVTITNSLNGGVTIIYGNTLLSCNVAWLQANCYWFDWLFQKLPGATFGQDTKFIED